MTSRPSAHTPENTILAGGVRLPAGSEVIADGKRVRLEAGAKAWQFTIRSSRLALGVPDHTLLVAERGEWAVCSCGSCVNRDRCTLVDNPAAILRHHGLLPGGRAWPEPYAPAVTDDDRAVAERLGPPADPGPHNLPPGNVIPALLDLEEMPDEEARALGFPYWTAADEPSPADPGGAAGGPPGLAGLAECEGAARDAPALDAALAAAGGWWSVSRSPGDWPVILTCNNCGATRGWQTEGEAARFIRVDGACRCDLPAEALAGPTPPAPGAARKPLDECLLDLYGG